MSKPRIYFEQVPLKVVKKILEDQAQQKKNGRPGAQDQEQEVSKDSSKAAAGNGGVKILPPKKRAINLLLSPMVGTECQTGIPKKETESSKP